MTNADSTLSSVITQLTQAISLEVEDKKRNPVEPATARPLPSRSAASRSQIFSLANTSFEGVYLFAGTATSAAPFVEDPSSSSGVQYNGNEQTNQIQIGEGQQVATSVPGDQLFGSGPTGVFASLQTLVNALQTGRPAN